MTGVPFTDGRRRPKPCPFCGSPAYDELMYTLGGNDRAVECSACGASGPSGQTDLEAIALWDYRLPAAED